MLSISLENIEKDDKQLVIIYLMGKIEAGIYTQKHMFAILEFYEPFITF